ncbi:hypothetical protein AVEN_90448-1 [Araneus ventricosus]|uniref:Uncharacterized protein n=1 Tax=Araneus ventricosus TaxID=182803 RepID=A0A4Y2TWY8_ARAVE|nr:hypothetical protein AVEN_90448-1 [Araneus ventricosus]
MQEIRQLVRDKFGEDADPGSHGLNKSSQLGNYGQSNTTNQPPISLDISLNSVNNTNQSAEATEMTDELMKEDNDVSIFSPGEDSGTPINEEVFKTQGKRRRSNQSQLDDYKVVK